MERIRFIPPTDNLPMLLVAVNLLLLCFFVLLNALATAPSPERDKHMQKVLAEVQEGYDVKGPNIAEEGTTPRVPTTPWATDMASKLQGVVVNRLSLNTVPMEADASRVVLTLPLNVLFAEEKLVGTEMVRSLMLAAQSSQLQWQLKGPSNTLVARAALLAEVTGRVTMLEAPTEALELVVKPGNDTQPQAARGLQNLGASQGVTVRGEAAP